MTKDKKSEKSRGKPTLNTGESTPNTGKPTPNTGEPSGGDSPKKK